LVDGAGTAGERHIQRSPRTRSPPGLQTDGSKDSRGENWLANDSLDRRSEASPRATRPNLEARRIRQNLYAGGTPRAPGASLPGESRDRSGEPPRGEGNERGAPGASNAGLGGSCASHALGHVVFRRFRLPRTSAAWPGRATGQRGPSGAWL